MKILGFSHIVSEVMNLEKSIKYYNNLGYTVEYEINQTIPKNKESILYGSPSKVKVVYLRNMSRSRIGIELIKHDVQTCKNDFCINLDSHWQYTVLEV